MKGVQCYELFGGIALKNHAFSFFISLRMTTTSSSTLKVGFAVAEEANA